MDIAFAIPSKRKRPAKKKQKEPTGVLEVYYDLNKGTQSYKINGNYYEESICDDDSIFAPMRPPEVAGLKKIPIDRPPTPPKRLYSGKTIEELYFHQVAELAEGALASYNKKHRTDYKLVEPLGKQSYYASDGNWFHVNFTAKPGNGDSSTVAALDGGNRDSSNVAALDGGNNDSSTVAAPDGGNSGSSAVAAPDGGNSGSSTVAALDGGNNNSSTKLFFAECRFFKSDDFVVTACCILDGVKTRKNCEICPPYGANLLHPTRGFRKGCYPLPCRVLRSRTRAMKGRVC